MSKDTYYFQHDYNSRNDDKILELRAEFGAAGYGIWWMLIESIAETEDGYLNKDRIAGLSLGFGISKDELSKIIDFCIEIELLKVEDSLLYSERMLEHKAIRKAAQEAGAKGAAKRWQKGKYSPPNSPPISDPNAKERKGEESKEKDIIIGQQQLEVLAKNHGLDLNYVKIHKENAAEYYDEKGKQLTLAKLNAWLAKDSQSKLNPSNPNRITPPYLTRRLA
jgi:hypothetical protein